MSRTTRIIYAVFLLLALLSYLFLPTREWGPETNTWNIINLLLDYNEGFADYLELWLHCITPLFALIILFLTKTKWINVFISIICYIPILITLVRCSQPDEDMYLNNIFYAAFCLMGGFILLVCKNKYKDMSDEAVHKRQLRRNWWKKWWWVIVLSYIALLGFNYLSSTLIERYFDSKPLQHNISYKHGKHYTPTIEDFADEIVKWISCIDTKKQYKDLQREYSLNTELSPNTNIVLRDVSYGYYKLQLTASFGNFKKAKKALPYQYDIYISFPINANVEQKYLQLYEELSKRLECTGAVDFRYGETEIVCMFDANGFRLTLGKDLYMSGQDDWSDF